VPAMATRVTLKIVEERGERLSMFSDSKIIVSVCRRREGFEDMMAATNVRQ
jgi:hypothetical protein